MPGMIGHHIVDPASPHLGGNLVGGDARCWFPDLWAWLIERFAVKTMLDVGCGEGHAVEWFDERNIQATGLDGLWWNYERCKLRGQRAILHDLTRCAMATFPVDLVWCCEVVEHIDERHLDNLLDTLANGRVIAMTAAQPGQDGHHHVNCQPEEYWVKKLATRGYRPLYEESNYGRSISMNGYFCVSGMIFERSAGNTTPPG